jgi:hypothetical protein
MWEQADQIVRQAAAQIADHIANFLPGLLVSLTLMVLAFIGAVLARMLVVRALRGLDFDRHVERWGVAALVGWPAAASPSHTVARALYWTILVLGVLVSLTALNATIPSRLAISVFEYVPHLLAALMILAVGAVAARVLARSVLIGAVNMQVQSARLLSLAAKWLVLIVTIAMALDHLGIGRSVLLLAFGIFFGGVVLAAALAVGLGTKDAVGRTIERHLRESARSDGPVDHV